MELNLKFLKFKKKYKKRGARIRPHLYWRYVLIVSFIIVLASFIFGWYLFVDVDKSSSLPSVVIENFEKAEKERIENILKYFEEKQEKSTDILNSSSPIVDPLI